MSRQPDRRHQLLPKWRPELRPPENPELELPRLLQIEDFAVSSVTKRGSVAHLPSMSIRQKTTSRHILRTRCIRCGAAPPPPAGTGRPRVHCGPGCRKAAYDDRRSQKPEAFQVRTVESTVVETVETVRTIDEGHDIVECVRRVTNRLGRLRMSSPLCVAWIGHP
jgi:hypothetical protein